MARVPHAEAPADASARHQKETGFLPLSEPGESYEFHEASRRRRYPFRPASEVSFYAPLLAEPLTIFFLLGVFRYSAPHAPQLAQDARTAGFPSRRYTPTGYLVRPPQAGNVAPHSRPFLRHMAQRPALGRAPGTRRNPGQLLLVLTVQSDRKDAPSTSSSHSTPGSEPFWLRPSTL